MNRPIYLIVKMLAAALIAILTSLSTEAKSMPLPENPYSITHVPLFKVNDSIDFTEDTISFADPKFKEYLIANFDTDNNGQISHPEAEAITHIDVCTDQIKNLSGIEHLKNLTHLIATGSTPGFGKIKQMNISNLTKLTTLNCSNNKLENLDISNNKKLDTLNCQSNKLKNLNVQNNKDLIVLLCNKNSIENEIIVSQNTKLQILNCGFNQKLPALDVSNNLELSYLDCYYNDIHELNISKNTKLQTLNCGYNKLSTLDLTKNVELKYLDCYHNQLTELNLSQNTELNILKCQENREFIVLDLTKNTKLKEIDCSSNHIKTLNVTKNLELQNLKCNDNLLISIDLYNNTKLETLECNHNQINNLDISPITELKTLDCGTNRLESLVMANCTKLTTLNCSFNNLELLNLSNNTAVENVNCQQNIIKQLDFTRNTALNELNCSSNSNLTSLDITQCTELKQLNCDSCSLSNLDLTKNQHITHFYCKDNKLTNNLNLAQNSECEQFNLTNNPNLDTIWVWENIDFEDPSIPYKYKKDNEMILAPRRDVKACGSYTYTDDIILTNSGQYKFDPLTLFLTINPNPKVVIQADKSTIISGENVNLKASCSVPATYLWNTNATTQIINVKPTTNTAYSVVVSDQNNCQDADTIEITVLSTQLVNISFDSNGGTGTMASVTVEKNSKYVLPACSFTPPTGKIFDKWDAGITGKQNDTIIVDNDLIIKAIWKNVQAEITFDPGDGTGTMDTVYVDKHSKYTLPACSFTAPESKIFDKWEWETSNTGQPGEKIAVDTNLIIKAIWKNTESGKLTISFTTGDEGTGSMASTQVEPNATFTLPPCGFKPNTGKTFDGWKIDESTTKQPGETITVTNTLTIIALWKNVNYTIRFNANNGQASTSEQTLDYFVETELTPNAFTKKGYTFNSWNTRLNGTGIKYADKQTVKGLTEQNNDTINLYAQWTANRYTIVFDGNNSNLGPTMETMNVEYDVTQKLNINTYSRKGYKFSGWNLQTDGNGTPFDDHAEIKNLSDVNLDTITLYAQWSPNHFTITFNANGGTGSMNDLQFVYDIAQDISANGFNKTGYTFNGWNTEKFATGTNYTNKQNVVNLTDEDGKTITLFAQWKANVYTVHFDGNGADPGQTMPDQQFTYDLVEPLDTNIFTRKSHRFDLWKTKIGTRDTTFKNKQNIKNLTAENGITLTFKAQWIELVTITFNCNGGSNNPEPITLEKGQQFILPNSPQPPVGKVFSHWQWGNNKGQPGETVTAETSVTITAIWTNIVYQLTIINGKATVDNQVVTTATIDQTVTITANEPEINHEFAQWEVSKGTVTLANKNSATTTFNMPAQDVEIKATYKEKEKVTITFKSNNGTSEQFDTVVVKGNNFVLPNCPFTPPANKQFDQWQWNNNKTGHPGDTIIVHNKLTIKAIWIDKSTAAEVAREQPIKIYPNPATNIIHVDGTDIKSIILYDILGQLVNSWTTENTETTILNVANYQPGIYMLRIVTNSNKIITRKIMINR